MRVSDKITASKVGGKTEIEIKASLSLTVKYSEVETLEQTTRGRDKVRIMMGLGKGLVISTSIRTGDN